MTSVIDETEYPVYTLDRDPEMEKKKRGTYSTEDMLEAVNTFLNTDTDMSKKKHGKYSIVEILQAVKQLNEQN
jgi:hypothetical protein